ncbi:MAG: protein kinase domain-containing protein [Myxococcota bacterium]
MAEQTILEDIEHGDARVRIERMLETGEHYQIVLGEDVETGEKVCIKAILYDADRLDDQAYVDARRDALEQERQFLDDAAPVDGIPDLVAYFETTGLDGAFEREPVLVYRYQPGRSLYGVVKSEQKGGVEPEFALEILQQLTDILKKVHVVGWIFRDLDPRHVLVDDDGEVSLVGCGNATLKSERPIAEKMDYADNPYVAPEVRQERSGKMLRPTADAYALGALMSFVLTGEEPRTVVENPLNHEAYEKLSNMEPPGLALIIAKCIQPMAKNRFGNFKRLEPYTTEDGLPTANTEGFGMLLLPAPFSGVENPEDNRALKSKLSEGPLISTARARKQAEEMEQNTPGAEVVDQSWEPSTWLVFALPAVILLTLGLLAAFGVI